MLIIIIIIMVIITVIIIYINNNNKSSECDVPARTIASPTIETQTRDCATVQINPTAVEQPTTRTEKLQ